MIVISGHSPQAEQHKAFQASHIRVRLLPELLHIIVLGNARTGGVDLLDQLPDGVLVKIYIGDGGEQPLHQQQSLFRGGGPPLADELAGVGDECAGQAVLRRCRVRAFAADPGLTGTGSAVRRLLALKTKHLFVHFRTLSSLDVVSMDGLAGLYTGRTRGVSSANIRGGAPLAGRAWNVR